MICDHLLQAGEAEFLAATASGERHEIEQSPQCVCRLYCRACECWHSYEISTAESAELPQAAAEDEIRRRVWLSIQRTRCQILSLSLRGLSARVIHAPEGVHVYLDGCRQATAELTDSILALIAACRYPHVFLHLPEENTSLELDVSTFRAPLAA